MSDHTQSDHLRQSALNAGLREAGQKPIRQMLEEKDAQIERLKAKVKLHQEAEEANAHEACAYENALIGAKQYDCDFQTDIHAKTKERIRTLIANEGELGDAKEEIQKLHRQLQGQCELVMQKDQRIAELTALLSEAMAVFKTYLNVPESRELKAQWEKLKNPYTPAAELIRKDREASDE